MQAVDLFGCGGSKPELSTYKVTKEAWHHAFVPLAPSNGSWTDLLAAQTPARATRARDSKHPDPRERSALPEGNKSPQEPLNSLFGRSWGHRLFSALAVTPIKLIKDYVAVCRRLFLVRRDAQTVLSRPPQKGLELALNSFDSASRWLRAVSR